jgi:phosphate-selective porin OprO/OprP
MAWFAGGFRDANGFGDDTGNDNVGEHNLTGRVTGRPYVSESGTEYVHLGISGSMRNPSNETVQYSSRPEVHTGPKFVDTGAIADIDSVFQWGLEAAGVMGPLSLQAEMLTSDLSGKNGQDDLTFNAMSAQVSYFLTGENREYDVPMARFDRVKVRKNYGSDGFGAWEVALRYSKLDLSDGNLDGHFDPSSGKYTAGGELTDWTLGLNWYLNPNTRVMFDVTQADRDGLDSIMAFTVRFAIDF